MSPSYTHGHHASVLRSHNRRTADNSCAYFLPHLDASMRLLDVGAGPGTITADLAGLVGGVVATEISPQVLALSQAEVKSRGLVNVQFEVEDVHQLTFPDDSFDVAHAHQVLQHVADPVQALREMGRVTRPGGLVAARDSDYEGFRWFPVLPELDRWMEIYLACATANGGSPDAGRRLLSWAQAAGFEDVEATSSTWCFATPQDRDWWGGMWAERIVESAIATQAVETGLASAAELASISEAWRRWSEASDGWFSVLHGQIVCRT